MAIRLKAAQWIALIPGTGGIVTQLARKAGTSWTAARNAIDRWPTVKEAYEEERQTTLDLAEAIILDNLKLAKRAQQPTVDPGTGLTMPGVVVDSGDARWMLATVGKDRGFSQRHEMTGASGGNIVIEYGTDFRSSMEADEELPDETEPEPTS